MNDLSNKDDIFQDENFSRRGEYKLQLHPKQTSQTHRCVRQVLNTH